MSLTGQALASSNAPAYRLGIRATPELAELADDLARTIGRAWPERTIPAQAYEDLATAIALLVILRDDDEVLAGSPTALEILEEADRRLADGVLEEIKAPYIRALGYDATDQAHAELIKTGHALWTELGERRIPIAARQFLGSAISLVADAGSPARDLYPGGLQ